MDNKILEEISKGIFINFNKLDEEQQINLMKTWNQDIWIKYCMQNTVSENDVFDPIMNLIEADEYKTK